MISVRARVKNGRLIVDEPTELAEGTEIDLISDEPPLSPEALRAWLQSAPPMDEEERLTPEELAELNAIAARDVRIPHEEVKRKLEARRLAELQAKNMTTVSWNAEAEKVLLQIPPRDAEQVLSAVEQLAYRGRGFVRHMLDGTDTRILYLTRYRVVLIQDGDEVVVRSIHRTR